MRAAAPRRGHRRLCPACTPHSRTLLPRRCTLVRAADVRRVQTPLPTPQPTADLRSQEDFTRDAGTVSACVELLSSYARSHAQGGDDGDGGGGGGGGVGGGGGDGFVGKVVPTNMLGSKPPPYTINGDIYDI